MLKNVTSAISGNVFLVNSQQRNNIFDSAVDTLAQLSFATNMVSVPGEFK